MHLQVHLCYTSFIIHTTGKLYLYIFVCIFRFYYLLSNLSKITYFSHLSALFHISLPNRIPSNQKIAYFIIYLPFKPHKRFLVFILNPHPKQSTGCTSRCPSKDFHVSLSLCIKCNYPFGKWKVSHFITFIRKNCVGFFQAFITSEKSRLNN